MKKVLLTFSLFVFFSFIIGTTILIGGTEKEFLKGFKGVKSPENYGSILLKNYADRYKEVYLHPVVFPHWLHRTKFTCKVCHSDIGFTMKAGADDITMSAIFAGKWCGECHNGNIAFAPLNCSRCHSLGWNVKENHDINDFLEVLPEDVFGNRIDWLTALEEGSITPKASKEGEEEMVIFDRDIEFDVVAPHAHPPNVIFPHKAHTKWLHCNNCHPFIFNMKAGGNPDMRMAEILKGKWCGVCHGKVAFPFNDCFRCHSEKVVVPF